MYNDYGEYFLFVCYKYKCGRNYQILFLILTSFIFLRYLKSVFPVVEETVLLDTLCSADNNVNQATETLLTMGFNKQHNIINIVPKLPRVTLTNNENDYEEDDMFWLRRKGYDHNDKNKSTCSSWPITSVTLLTPTKQINTDEQIKSKHINYNFMYN